MLDLDDMAAAAVATPVADPPPVERLRNRAVRRRRRRRATAVVAAGCVVAGVAVGGMALVPSNGGPAHVRTAGGTTAGAAAVTKPVLTSCPPTSAQEGTFTGAGVTDPEQPGEVFADPSQGARGPLAVFVSLHGVHTLASTPNALVVGGQARVDVASNGQGGVDWLTPDGDLGVIRAHRLSTADLTALATALSGTRGALPAGLTSLGPTTSASWAQSTCADGGNLRASVEVVTGPQATRYARLVTEPSGQSWDQGDTTFLVVTAPGTAAPGPDTVRQATDQEWQQLLGADRSTTSPSTVAPGSGTGDG